MDKNRHEPIIDNLRYLLLVLVVLAHCKLYEFTTVTPTAGWIMHLFSLTLTWACVPVYFVISAFFFFKGMEERFSWKSYTSKLSRRVRSLLVPYLLWNIIALLFLIIKTAPALADFFPQYDSIDLSPANIIRGFWSTEVFFPSGGSKPYDFVLWFVRDLIVLNICAPVFWLAARYIPRTTLAVLTALIVCIELDAPWLPDIIYLTPPRPIYFYFIGAMLAIQGHSLVNLGRYAGPLLLPAIAAAVAYTCFEQEGYPRLFRWFYVICFIPISIKGAAIFTRTPQPWIRPVMHSGFFVYAFHGLWASMSATAILRLLDPHSTLMFLVAYLLDFTCLLGLSTAVWYLCRRFVPRITAVLCGMRG